MTREDTIQILSDLNQQKPAYFRSKSKSEKQIIIQEWQACLSDENVSLVRIAMNEYLKVSKLAPFPRELKNYIELNREYLDMLSNPWYEHFPKSGIIPYSDKDVEWASWDDWNLIPTELLKRMKYVPDPDDQERNQLIEIVNTKIEKLKQLRRRSND